MPDLKNEIIKFNSELSSQNFATQKQKLETKAALRELNFLKISGGSLKEIYSEYAGDKYAASIQDFEILQYPLTVNQLLNSLDTTAKIKKERSLSLMLQYTQKFMEDGEKVVAYEVPMLVVNSQWLDLVLDAMNANDKKYTYRLPTLEELIWVVKKSNMGDKLGYKYDKSLNEFDLQWPFSMINLLGSSQDFGELINASCAAECDVHYLKNERFITINGEKFFFPFSNTLGQVALGPESKYISLLSIESKGQGSQLVESTLLDRQNMDRYNYLRLIREPRVKGVSK